jgi:inhibitor of KinA
MSILVYEQIASFNLLLNEHPFTGFTETVPAYNTITVFYQPELMITFDKSPTVFVKRHIEKLISEKSIHPTLKKNYVSIPVCYDEEFGPDLPYISETNGISVQQLIATHQQKDYHVYMMGFLPGFSYMGEVDDTIAVSRKASPRAVIEKGSVGIAGNQTGIYPLTSPGGWQIIGRTPYCLFDTEKEDPFFLRQETRCISNPSPKKNFTSTKRRRTMRLWKKKK